MCSHTSWSTMVASQSATSVPDISASHFCTWEWTIVLIFGNQSTVTTGITQYVQSYLLVHRVCLKICNICTRRFCITHQNLWMKTTVYFWTPVYYWHIVWFVKSILTVYIPLLIRVHLGFQRYMFVPPLQKPVKCQLYIY